ncbi:hypothetical protein POM88_013197 [Heracleum sosnowskyi]|uniref:Uncharacterized protein n=1 Tax=Heracleum sosnowskyi TaxID=360622 RepID=A0AAD8N321_9APIA|nr:hypothetical protein POM88_013197 [Heracleum sosnowskyi]
MEAALRGIEFSVVCLGLIFLADRATGVYLSLLNIVCDLTAQTSLVVRFKALKQNFSCQKFEYQKLRCWLIFRTLLTKISTKRCAHGCLFNVLKATILGYTWKIFLSQEDAGSSKKAIVVVKQKNILATAFHPELTEDTQWHIKSQTATERYTKRNWHRASRPEDNETKQPTEAGGFSRNGMLTDTQLQVGAGPSFKQRNGDQDAQ